MRTRLVIYAKTKLSIKILYSFLQEVVHTPSAVVVAVVVAAVATVPLSSDINISRVDSLLANIVSGVAKRHVTSAARLIQFRLCKASAKSF